MTLTAHTLVEEDESDLFTAPLHRLSTLLDKVLDSSPVAAEDARSFVHAGKRLRARLIFAIASGRQLQNEDQHVRCAAAIELVHAASLLHDDIVDRSAERRGAAALYRVRGTRAAALTGMCLAHLALELVAELPETLRRRFAEAGRDAARGQFAETVRLEDTNVTPADRLVVMEKKTASIFGLACELGAASSGYDRAATVRFRAVGAAFGMLFQIADDVDDLFASAPELGRMPGADLRQGVVSVPIAFALQTEAGPELNRLLGRTETARRVARCRDLLWQCGALQRSCDAGNRYLMTARRHLARLPDTCGTRWIASLLASTAARIERHLTNRFSGRSTESVDLRALSGRSC